MELGSMKFDYGKKDDRKEGNRPKRKKRDLWYLKYILVLLLIIALIIIFLVSAYKTRDTYISLYNQAVELEEQGRYTDAYTAYVSLYIKTGDYKDIISRMNNIKEYNYYNEAIQSEDSGEYFKAMKIFLKIYDFEDSEDHFDNCARKYLESK